MSDDWRPWYVHPIQRRACAWRFYRFYDKTRLECAWIILRYGHRFDCSRPGHREPWL
jgi:hypothetical protein